MPHLINPVKPKAGPMLSDARTFWRLPRRKLDRLLALTHQADHVELKLVVPVAAHAATCTSLGVDLSRASARKVYYLDTADLVLERHGVVARIRSVDNKPDDSVIKLRPVDPGDLPARLRRSKRFGVEVDAMPGRFVCTGALRRRLGRNDVERTMAKGRPLRALFSKEQLALLAAHAPAHVDINDLAVFGPVDVRRAKVLLDGLDRVLSVERWTYPDGSSILELSTRCAAAAAVPVTAQVASVLRAYNVDVTGFQQTKTRATLAYFGCTQRLSRNK
jgi:hypothetical protein